MYPKEKGSEGPGLDWYASEEGQETGYFEQGHELSGSIKRKEFLH